MRNTIFIFTLFLLTACHNKNDLKRISDLEKENKKLTTEVDKINNLYSNFPISIIDSIIHRKQNEISRECYAFNTYIITSNSRQQRIQLNKECYNSQIRFGIDMAYMNNVTFSYSIPQKTKSTAINYIDIINDNHFNFEPKDTGWYYWNGLVKIRNLRTEETTLYPIIDSFYVYK